MAAQYIQKFATTAEFLASASDRVSAQGFGFVGDVLYANVGGVAVAIHTQNATVESVITTRLLAAADSGKTFILNLAAGFAVTLPAPAAGLKYRFIVGIAPSGGSYTIVSSGSAQVIYGSVNSSTGGNADSTTGDPATTITLADGAAVIGDWVEMISDGTNWYTQTFVDADAGATYTG